MKVKEAKMKNTGALAMPGEAVTKLKDLLSTLEAIPIDAEVEDQPADEAQELLGDCIDLSERAIASDGTFPVKLIQPGWGSSGYYSKEMLQRDVPRVFPHGTQMFWNHQTAGEEAQRPEGDLRNLAAVIVETPHYDEAGPAGPGMYAKGKAFGDYKASIEELAPHIGVSIRAFGSGVKGEAEGRKGRIISELKAGRSVDFVTKPGAGGRVLELFESARSGAPTPPPQEEAHNMDELHEAQRKLAESETQLTAARAQVSELTESNSAKDAEIATLREHELLGKARATVEAGVNAAKLPDVTKTRLIESLAANPPVTDGAIDEAAYAEAIKTAIDEAATEVAAIAGGQVTGMGPSGAPGGQAALKESFKRGYLARGLSEEESEKRAAFAASGR
jgi:hypothetical protein